jgi:hypothetical protein
VTSISGDFSGFERIQNSRGSRQIFPKKVTEEDFSENIRQITHYPDAVKPTYKLQAGLRICVHYIRIRIQHFLKIWDPDPGL